MSEAPNAFQLDKTYNIKIKDDEYVISLIDFNSSLEINVSLKNSFPKISYSNQFSLDELKKLSVYYLLFKKISNIISNIKNMLVEEKSRNLEINENNNILKLILIPLIENIDKITLCLKQKEINKDEIIQELIKSNTKLNKKVEYLEKEILDIKKILELNNLLFNKEIQSSILKGNDESKFIYDCIGKKNIMFKLIYKMTKDGNDKKYFHEKCDKKEQHYVYLK